MLDYIRFYPDTIFKFITIPITIGGLTFTFLDILIISILCGIIECIIKGVF